MKHENILASANIEAIMAATLELEGVDMPVDAGHEHEQERSQEAAAELAKKGLEPFDLFGDHTLTGRQELTRDMLPDAIYDYAVDSSKRPGLNAGPIAVGCLAAAAAAIREGWKIQPKLNDPDWKERPILWVGITGSSGAKKTHAVSSAKAPLDAIERIWFENNIQARKGFQKAKAEYNQRMIVWRKEFKDFEKERVYVRREQGDDAADAMRFDLELPEKPQEPVQKRLTVGDTTTEAVMKVCATNPAGILQVRDELTGWIASFDLYNGGGGSRDRAVYLTGYNGGRETKDRAGDEDGPLVVHTFAVSLLGGIQDDIIRRKFSSTEHDGFLARFLFVKAEVLGGSDSKPDAKAAKAYFDIIGTLASLSVDANGEGIVKMSKEAAAIRKDIENIAIALHDHPSIRKGLSDHLNKWPGIFSRLCLIFHMIEWGMKGKNPEYIAVREDTARRAYNLLTKYFLPEAARVYNEVMEGGDEQEQHARWIAGHILAHKKERITTHEIRRAFSSIANDDWALKKATATLEIMAWITPDTKKDGKTLYDRSDFAKMKWRVNPRVHELFAEQAVAEEKRRRETVEKIQAGADAIRMLKSKPETPTRG